MIGKSSQVYPQVEKITICIGTNDCSRGEINEGKIIDNTNHLITVTKEVFPNAILNFLAIPPMNNAKANKVIKIVNKNLKKCVLERGELFRDCNTLWYHVNPDGSVDKGLLVDTVHLSDWGLGLLLQNVISFFYTLHFPRGRTQTADSYPLKAKPTPPDYIFTVENFPHLRRNDKRDLNIIYPTRRVDYSEQLSTLETWV